MPLRPEAPGARGAAHPRRARGAPRGGPSPRLIKPQRCFFKPAAPPTPAVAGVGSSRPRRLALRTAVAAHVVSAGRFGEAARGRAAKELPLQDGGARLERAPPRHHRRAALDLPPILAPLLVAPRLPKPFFPTPARSLASPPGPSSAPSARSPPRGRSSMSSCARPSPALRRPPHPRPTATPSDTPPTKPKSEKRNARPAPACSSPRSRFWEGVGLTQGERSAFGEYVYHILAVRPSSSSLSAPPLPTRLSSPSAPSRPSRRRPPPPSPPPTPSAVPR